MCQKKQSYYEYLVLKVLFCWSVDSLTNKPIKFFLGKLCLNLVLGYFPPPSTNIKLYNRSVAGVIGIKNKITWKLQRVHPSFKPVFTTLFHNLILNKDELSPIITNKEKRKDDKYPVKIKLWALVQLTVKCLLTLGFF